MKNARRADIDGNGNSWEDFLRRHTPALTEKDPWIPSYTGADAPRIWAFLFRSYLWFQKARIFCSFRLRHK